MKRLCQERKDLLIPYLDKFIEEISTINQASTMWTLAQLFLEPENEMSRSQINEAKKILKINLENSNDWIVLNMTMQTLGEWSRSDTALTQWILPRLEKFSTDSRKSVSGRAKKLLLALYNE